MKLSRSIPRRSSSGRGLRLGRRETGAEHRSAETLPGPQWVLELLSEAVADQRSDWRAECAEVSAAFDAWSRACCDRASAFADYWAALDREERASEIYRDLLEEERRSRR